MTLSQHASLTIIDEVPTGGTTGQVLAKASNNDYDLQWVNAGSGTGTVTSVTGLNTDNTNPATPIVKISVDGVTITGAGTPGSPLVSTGGSSFAWSEVTAASFNFVKSNGYITNNAGVVTGTLPATAAIGDNFRVGGKGAGGWKIAQNASQIIHFGIFDSATGTGGSLASTARYDALELVCITANTDFLVISCIGNIAIV